MKTCLHCGQSRPNTDEPDEVVFYGPTGEMKSNDLVEAVLELERYRTQEAVLTKLITDVAKAIRGENE